MFACGPRLHFTYIVHPDIEPPLDLLGCICVQSYELLQPIVLGKDILWFMAMIAVQDPNVGIVDAWF